MAERDISLDQILNCLRHGNVPEYPHRDIYGNWKFEVTCPSAGAHIDVVVAIDWPSKAIIITTY